MGLLLKKLLPPIPSKSKQTGAEKEHGGRFRDSRRECFKTVVPSHTIRVPSHDVIGVVDAESIGGY